MKLHLKRTIAVIAIISIFFSMGINSTYAAVEGKASKFKDVPVDYWAYNSINSALNKGYAGGYPDDTLKQEATVTRAEFIKMLVTALELPVISSEGKWYSSYVSAAESNQLYVSTDFANTDLMWNKPITRKEMARFAVRASGKTTTDDKKWMYLATKAGLITGLGAGELGESEASSRAQALVIIDRILSSKSGKQLTTDKYAVSSAEIAWHGTNIFTVMPEIFKDTSEWKTEKMVITSKDKMYQAKLDALIAIDLEDPNDPNLKLLPSLDKLKWFNGKYDKEYFVKDQKKSYIFYFKGGTVYNKNPKAYSSKNQIRYLIDGFNAPNRDLFYDKGVLNKQAPLYVNKLDDIPASIIPKKGSIHKGDLSIEIQVPSVSTYYFSTSEIIEVKGSATHPRYP